jgi:hypothetical protein
MVGEGLLETETTNDEPTGQTTASIEEEEDTTDERNHEAKETHWIETAMHAGTLQ